MSWIGVCEGGPLDGRVRAAPEIFGPTSLLRLHELEEAELGEGEAMPAVARALYEWDAARSAWVWREDAIVPEPPEEESAT